MTAQHWLGGANVPPYLEVLPPPQPAPRVEWDHSATPSTAAPAAAVPHAAPPPAAIPPPQAEQVGEDVSSRDITGVEAVALERPAGEEIRAADAAAAAAPVEGLDGVDQSTTPSSLSNGDASGGGPPATRQDIPLPAAVSPPMLETTSSSGANWRGGAPKIKVRRLGRLPEVFVWVLRARSFLVVLRLPRVHSGVFFIRDTEVSSLSLGTFAAFSRSVPSRAHRRRRCLAHVARASERLVCICTTSNLNTSPPPVTQPE